MMATASIPHLQVGEAEILMVDSRNIACDGGDGPLGHPRVWLHIEHEQTFCPYCSRIYRLKPGAGADHGH
jgi:uncharacterized Zn-finger protein